MEAVHGKLHRNPGSTGSEEFTLPAHWETSMKSGKYDLVFYGHTHKPWAEKIGNCLLANPGELAGQRFKPTFAIYDIQKDKLQLKILELV